MNCGKYVLIVRVGGHMVLMVGYQVQNGTMTIMYWNSGTSALESTTYNGQNTYIAYNGSSWKWDFSVLIPYTY